MITVGLVKELLFISRATNRAVYSSLFYPPMLHPVSIGIEGNILLLSYQDEVIWREDVGSDISMFGIESCHTIAQIVNLIDKKDPRWKELLYIEEST